MEKVINTNLLKYDLLISLQCQFTFKKVKTIPSLLKLLKN